MRTSWLTLSDAVAATGLSQDQIIGRARRGSIKRKENRDGFWLYAVKETAHSPKAKPHKKSTPADVHHIVQEFGAFRADNILPLDVIKHDDVGGHGPNYIYDDARDTYIFSLRSKANVGRPLVLAGNSVRQMVLAYSRDGGDATLNELSRAFGLHRASVRETLAALSKTHDSAPFTDEDIAKRTEEDLGEDLIRLKEERVLRHAERVQWAETTKLAAKARNMNRFIFDKMEDILKGACEGLPVFLPVEREAPTKESFTVFATPSDLHYGKAGWKDETGEEYNREECYRRLLATTDVMLERVSRFGKPARFIVGAGSDWFHIDNETNGGSTTRGTPQDTDGTWSRIFLEGSELAAAYLERLRAVAPVTVVCMAGNHDRLSSLMLTAWLKERFRAAGDVTVEVSPASRHYLRVGQTLVGITHGDDTKDQKLPGLMAAEAREAWGQTKHRLWFTGHWHSMISNEFHGVRVIHVPSLAGTDLWHARSGYIGNRKALTAYIIEDAEGMIAELPVSAR